ncbi:MAG: hypothetical protein WCV50_01285 [Patescibacteria group bacterium]|jgi:hypothetical protein
MFKRGIIILEILLLCLPLAAKADVGPKPSADFSFTFQIPTRPTIVSAALYECQDPLCAKSEPLKDVGPQRMTCDQNSCSSMAYGYNDYQKLVVEFSDKAMRTSDVFQSAKSMHASYTVNVYDTYLKVENSNPISGAEAGWGLISIFGALASITIIIELIVSTVYLLLIRFRGKQLLKMLGIVILANIISTAIFYTAYWLLNGGMAVYIIGEIGVVIIEAFALFYFSKKSFSLKRAFILSLLMNVFSAVVGLTLFI